MKNLKHKPGFPRINQKPKSCFGGALITSLLLLMVLTILALSSMESSVMEQKMSMNTRQSEIAFQAAETALREGESWLQNNVISLAFVAGNFTSNSGLYDNVRTYGKDFRRTWDLNDPAAWTDTSSRSSSKLGIFTGDQDGNKPRFIIEYLGRAASQPALDPTAPQINFHAFRVSAIGWGLRGKSKVVLSSTVRLILI